jgi:hypothetical protein
VRTESKAFLQNQELDNNGCNFEQNIRYIHNVRKTQHQHPLFGHKGDEIFKKQRKKYTGVKGVLKFRLTPNLIKFEFHHVFFVSLIGFNEYSQT